jgi:urate oxidase
MATSLEARWRFATPVAHWDSTFERVLSIIIREYAVRQSLALQQTLWDIGSAVLHGIPEIAEIRMSAPNKHHFEVDLAPFGLDNPGEVYYAADRPYGLIEATVLRDDAPAAEGAWR